MTYVQKYRPWLLSVINERIHIGASFSTILRTAAHLRILIDENGYYSPPKLASFIIRKENEIRSIIPQNRGYEKQIQKLNSAIKEAQEYQTGFRNQ